MAISSLHLSEKSSPNWKTTWSRQLTFKSFTLPKMTLKTHSIHLLDYIRTKKNHKGSYHI